MKAQTRQGSQKDPEQWEEPRAAWDGEGVGLRRGALCPSPSWLYLWSLTGTYT